MTTEALGGGARPALGRAVGPITKGTLPDLREVRVDEALTALSDAGLNYVVVETDTVTGQSDIVLSQDPPAGTKAKGGTSVTLVVPKS